MLKITVTGPAMSGKSSLIKVIIDRLTVLGVKSTMLGSELSDDDLPTLQRAIEVISSMKEVAIESVQSKRLEEGERCKCIMKHKPLWEANAVWACPDCSYKWQAVMVNNERRWIIHYV